MMQKHTEGFLYCNESVVAKRRAERTELQKSAKCGPRAKQQDASERPAITGKANLESLNEDKFARYKS